jgi:hypothetical protein
MKRLFSLLPISFIFVFLVVPTFSFYTTRGIRVNSKEEKELYLYKIFGQVISNKVFFFSLISQFF